MSITRNPSLFTLKILPLSEFTPLTPKALGTRPGSIGKFKSEDSQFMVKYEGYGYETSVIGKSTENDVVESITAQIIRAIWGPHLVPDIHIAKADIDLPHTYPFLVTPTNETVKVRFPYMLASLWINTARPLYNLVLHEQHYPASFAAQLTVVQTIAKLVGISDYKFENMIIDSDGENLMLVDCAANYQFFSNDTSIAEILTSTFNSIDLGTNFQRDVAIQTMIKFIKYKDVDTILSQYSDIISSKTLNQITDRMRKTQLTCENYLIKLGELPSYISNSKLFDEQQSIPYLIAPNPQHPAPKNLSVLIP